VQRLIVPLADYKCFVDYRQQMLGSVKEAFPVLETTLQPFYERLA
jgi:hypothetical protein